MSEQKGQQNSAELLLAHLKAYGSMSVEQKECTGSPWWVIIDPERFKDRLQNCDMEDMGDIASLIIGVISGPYLSRATAENYLRSVSHHFTRSAVVYCCGARDAYEWEWFAKNCQALAAKPCGVEEPEAKA